MKLKSFFWQVFFALVLLCISSLILFYKLYRVVPNPDYAIYITLAVILAISFFIAYRLSRPLEVLRHHLSQMAEGHLANKVKSLDTDLVEIHQLAAAMEKVRDQLQQRIQLITLQKNEQDALLASMVEGVIAVDHEMQILHVNKSAGQILSVSSDDSIGQSLHEVVRVPEVLDSVELSLKQHAMHEKDIELVGRKTKYLQLHVSPLRMADDERYGAVLVFSDVSRIRELEGMRKNFVANVSHELRTPLTSIQGFAETLLNPTIKDPNEIKKYLEIIQRHAARLGRIIEDILTLSRIERDSESSQIEKRNTKLRPILMTAYEICQMKGAQKKINIKINCSEDLQVEVDPSLIEQAVINLVDNAIRYSNTESTIHVNAEQKNNEIHIDVVDQGVGIEQKQLSRIFERFYRVDKARSRELGGTGLGLSIVKHISIAHKGRVEVKSELGKGSTFTIVLPMVTRAET